MMRWIGVVNIVLAAMIVLAAIFFAFSEEEDECLVIAPRPIQKELPKSHFAESEEFFEGIGEGLLALTWVPPQMQLPDLRQELLYFGKNNRPDALIGKGSVHLALKSSSERLTVKEGERAYLVYQGNYSPKNFKSQNLSQITTQVSKGLSPLWGEESAIEDTRESKNTYAFSPGNQPTPLWFEIKNANEQTLEVRISMLDEKGVLVSSPSELRSFHLQAQEFPKAHIIGWDLSGYRVDTTLLVRQKARWIGADLFLHMHGGDDFLYTIGKERIDFLDSPEPYSCFVSVGDFLVWDGKRWQRAENVNDPQHLPLLVVKKIDEKIMTFELWDSEGKGKTILSLIRAKDHHGNPNIAHEIKFVGAKTWAQFIVECRSGKRLTLKLHDWLVLTPEGWTKLDSAEKIDAFVENHLSGPLFVLDKIAKHNGRQVLIGHLFNATRTEVEHVELTATPTTVANSYRPPHPPSPVTSRPLEITLEGSEE